MNTHISIERFIRGVGSAAMGRMLADLADIALVVGKDGIVRDVAHVGEPAESLDPAAWRGRRFADTIAAASQPAASHLLEELQRGSPIGGQELYHEGPSDRFVAVRYGGAPLEGGADVLLVGRAVAEQERPESVDFGALFAVGAAAGSGGHPGALADILRHGNDLVALIDAQGRLLWANDAFQAAAEISLVSGVSGRFLEDLLVWQHDVDLSALMEKAAEAGACDAVPAALRGDAGGGLDVTIGLTRLPRSAPPVYGAVIRPAGRAGAPAADHGEPFMEALLDRAGQEPLKGLVRETADLVERHCVQAALQLSDNNRSAAARALGISRQALYQKLERYGLLEK